MHFKSIAAALAVAHTLVSAGGHHSAENGTTTVTTTTRAASAHPTTSVHPTTAASPSGSSSAAKPSSSSSTSPLTPVPYWKNFNSTIDPNNIKLPSLNQLTSYDPVAECAYYTPTGLTFDPKQWPTTWQTATSNGMANSPEFLSVKNSIDWTKAPNIPVRTKNADGSLNFAGYDTATDPVSRPEKKKIISFLISASHFSFFFGFFSLSFLPFSALFNLFIFRTVGGVPAPVPSPRLLMSMLISTNVLNLPPGV
ncbi:hypothetical protein DM01DRAFT_1132653 [Hesseltinella vesiculosa]|uniref:Uncharacterized protein n=1 Tax=Hesseltinella vesiculosa TaxID=101127 RepID=A0A1X2G9B8_9FUNG|nr:hypothetical protein DM01DRAFT_1132653 [Hesseltinella vesiculosa]